MVLNFCVHKMTLNHKGQIEMTEWSVTVMEEPVLHYTAAKQLCSPQLHPRRMRWKASQLNEKSLCGSFPQHEVNGQEPCASSSGDCLSCHVLGRVARYYTETWVRLHVNLFPSPTWIQVVWPQCPSGAVCLQWFAKLQVRWRENQVETKNKGMENAKD